MSETLTQETAAVGADIIPEPRPDLAGLLISSPGDPNTVWLIMPGGYRALVPGGPTGQTFKNLFVPGAGIISDINAGGISEEQPITEGAVLAKDKGGTVYLISQPGKWPITAQGFRRYQFNPASVVAPPQILLDFIPDGRVINWS
jgi:hypothetical protein